MLDVGFLLIFLVITLSGFSRGLARQVFDLAGLIVSFLVAVSSSREISQEIGRRLVPGAAGILVYPVFFHISILDVITFVVIFTVLRLFFHYLGSLTGIVFHIPLVSTFDRLLGAVFGFIKGVLVVAIIILVLAVVPTGPVRSLLAESRIYQILTPLLFFILSFF